MEKGPHIIYRQAGMEDTDLCYRIKTRSIKPYVRAVYGWDEEFQSIFHRETFRPENTRILSLGEHEDDVFGYIETEYREKETWLANILIDESFQGRGLGGFILRRLIKESLAKGLPVRLEVFRVNAGARKFYDRLGFKAVTRDRIKWVMERG